MFATCEPNSFYYLAIYIGQRVYCYIVIQYVRVQYEPQYSKNREEVPSMSMRFTDMIEWLAGMTRWILCSVDKRAMTSEFCFHYITLQS